MGNKEINKESNIDWNKFKIKTKISSNVAQAKNAYIEFCKMLDEFGFELVSDYIGNQEKVELIYKLDDCVYLNMRPNIFKTYTYKSILNFKNNLKKNSDKFIKFVGLTNGKLIAKIKTFDNGEVELDIANYNQWNKGRQDFYKKLKEVNGHTTDYYKSAKEKINIYVDDARLNLMDTNGFKRTYKSIVNFKKELEKNGDKFIKFIDSYRNLIAKIKTFDGGEIDIDIGVYNQFKSGRQSTYNYCEFKKYNLLSPYLGNVEKILIDFNCGHKPHWILPHNLKKDTECPICKESKGEKTIRSYLENNEVEFIQEYRFDDCKYKRSLPFDFYIPSKNLCIEFDGIQHFESSDFFGGEESFKETQIRDKIKNKYCKDNGINLLRIPYYNMDNIEEILDREFNKL